MKCTDFFTQYYKKCECSTWWFLNWNKLWNFQHFFEKLVLMFFFFLFVNAFLLNTFHALNFRSVVSILHKHLFLFLFSTVHLLDESMRIFCTVVYYLYKIVYIPFSCNKIMFKKSTKNDIGFIIAYIFSSLGYKGKKTKLIL